jgi:HK97 family phage prohead protease
MIKCISSTAFKAAVKSTDPHHMLGVTKDLTAATQMVGDRTLRFVISTEAVDRDDDVIKASGWQLENYKRNPVVMFNHLTDGFPIAKCTWIKQVGKELHARVEFAPANIPIVGPQAEAVFQLCKSQFMSATSVGFKPLEWKWAEGDKDGIVYETSELLEFSIVSVPSNPFALIQPDIQSDARSNALNTRENYARRLRLLELNI